MAALSDYLGGLADTLNPLPAIRTAEQAYSAAPPGLGAQAAIAALVGNLAQSQYEQFKQAAADAKNTKEMPAPQDRALSAFGHTLAGLLPVLGPAAANAGENIGNGKTAYGLGQATALLAPFVARGASLAGESAPASDLSSEAGTLRVGQKAVGDAKYPDNDVRYVRFGKPPESGKSFNSMDKTPEAGVSVYRLVKHGDKWLLDDQGSGFSTLSDPRPLYEVKGELINDATGADGEPLLDKVRGAKKLQQKLSDFEPIDKSLFYSPEDGLSVRQNQVNGKIRLSARGMRSPYGSDINGWMTPDQIARAIRYEGYEDFLPDRSRNMFNRVKGVLTHYGIDVPDDGVFDK